MRELLLDLPYLLSWYVLFSFSIFLKIMMKLFQARDPEREEVAYSITAGNELGHFTIDRNNGTLIIASSLDREELSRYSLTVKAQDPGGLSSSVRANIRVLDVNDRKPEFIDLPYVFNVRENDVTGYVGRVRVKFSLKKHLVFYDDDQLLGNRPRFGKKWPNYFFNPSGLAFRYQQSIWRDQIENPA